MVPDPEEGGQGPLSTRYRDPMFDYTSVTADAITDLTAEAIARAEGHVASIVENPGERTFANTMMPIDEITNTLAVAYGEGAFLSNVHPDERVRDAARAAEEQLTKWQVGLTFRRDLYESVHAFATTSEARSLTGEARRLLDFTIRDFRRAGHELSTEDRSRLQEMQNRMVELGIEFQKNIADVEDKLIVTDADLDGLPEDYVRRLQPGPKPGTYEITMAYPDVIPFMENARRRDLRERLLRLFHNRAADENRPILEEAISLREQMAALFGLPSWADYQMEVKMAKRPDAVDAFYRDLIPPLTEIGKKELAVLTDMLTSDAGDTTFQAWDRQYYDTQLRKRDFGVDPTEVAAYFSLDDVVAGLLDLTGEVFGLEYRRRDDLTPWHQDVIGYDILDRASGEHLAIFLADLFPRDGKYSHAAAFPLVPGRRNADGSYQLPLSSIVANFTKPSGNTPSLLQHSEVETLFHEFGHILHMSLGHTEFTRFSGASTEWDFVEAPSQIMEEWCWQPEVLQRFARHHETGETIPTELVNRLVAARHLDEALSSLRQVSFGVLDLRLHGPGDHSDLDAIALESESLSLMPHTEGTFFPASFGHLLGGYDAGYYGYLWSKVFGLDMFSRFEESGVTNPEVGLAYRRAILEKGGSRDAFDLLRDFLGREPNNEAFLRHLGLAS